MHEFRKSTEVPRDLSDSGPWKAEGVSKEGRGCISGMPCVGGGDVICDPANGVR